MSGALVSRRTCATCTTGRSRETVGMTCQTCGTDYSAVIAAVDILKERGETESLMWGALNLSDDTYWALAYALSDAGLLK